MSGNDVKITEGPGGSLVVQREGFPAIDIWAAEAAALRAYFAAERNGDYFEGLEEGIKIGRAERMPEDVQALVEKAQARTGEWTDIANATTDIRLIDRLTAALEAAYSQNAEQVWEYQCRLTGNAWTDVSAGHRCQGERRRRVVAGPWQPVEKGAVDEPR